jgi:hypothetical protein
MSINRLPALASLDLAALGATVHPTHDTLPGVIHGDIRLPNGYGLSVAHSSHHYCGADTVEVVVIFDDGSGTWPLDRDSTIPSEFGGHGGAILGWADAATVRAMLTRLASLPPRKES